MSEGHNGPSGPIQDISTCDIRAEAMEAFKAAGEPTSHRTFWPTLHNMTEKAKAMYEIFCEARAITRATHEGQANATEFFDVGKEQGDKMAEIMEQVAVSEKNNSTEYNANGS
jgi:hypothetical protein